MNHANHSPGFIALPVSTQDVLIFRIWNAANPLTLSVNTVVQRPDGQIVRSQQIFTPATSVSLESVPIQLPEGNLIAASVVNTAGSPRPGETFISASLRVGASATANPHIVLFSDYLHADVPLGWPGAGQNQPSAGIGLLKKNPVATPAVGVDFTHTFAAGRSHKIIAVRFTLAADSNAGNRRVYLELFDGSDIVFQTLHTTAVQADETRHITAAPGLETIVESTFFNMALPVPTLANPLWTFRSNIVGIQVGDQLSNIDLTTLDHIRT